MKRQYRLDRLRAIEREYKVAQIADRVLRQALPGDPALLFGERLKPADARTFSENLAATYLLRLFAEFEAGLRDLWHNGDRRRGNPQDVPPHRRHSRPANDPPR